MRAPAAAIARDSLLPWVGLPGVRLPPVPPVAGTPTSSHSGIAFPAVAPATPVGLDLFRRIGHLPDIREMEDRHGA